MVHESKIVGMSSRVVNGKPSSNTYPWMVKINQKLYFDPKFITSYDDEFENLGAAGFFISDKAVLTCAHCICNPEKPSKSSPGMYTCGQENPLGKNKENLNIKGMNEINIEFGKNFAVDDDYEYDENIEAYVYKYERSLDEDSIVQLINGDIGILIAKRDVDIQNKKVVPICLPIPVAFEKKSPIDVKFVGWGFRTKLIDFNSIGGTDDHYCLTNGAREPDRGLYPDSGGISIVKCDYNQEEKKFCFGGNEESTGFSKRNINTLSYKTKMMFNKNMFDDIERDPSYKACVKYMKLAANKWANDNKKLHPETTYEGIPFN